MSAWSWWVDILPFFQECIFSCHQPAASKPFECWLPISFITKLLEAPISDKLCAKLMALLCNAIVVSFTLDNTHVGESSKFCFISQIVQPLWRFFRLHTDISIWPQLQRNTWKDWWIILPVIFIFLMICHLEVLAVVVHGVKFRSIIKLHCTDRCWMLLTQLHKPGFLWILHLGLLVDLFISCLLLTMSSCCRVRSWSHRHISWACCWAWGCYHWRSHWHFEERRCWRARQSQRWICHLLRLIVSSFRWIVENANGIGMLYHVCIFQSNLRLLLHFLHRVLFVVDGHIGWFIVLTLLFKSFLSDCFSVLIKELGRFHISNWRIEARSNGCLPALCWHHSSTKAAPVLVWGTVEVEVKRHMTFPASVDSSDRPCQNQVGSIVEQVWVLRVNLPQKHHALPSWVAFWMALLETENWFTKLAYLSIVLLATQKLKACNSTSCCHIGPVDDPCRMPHGPCPHRTWNWNFNSKLFTKSMHEESSKWSHSAYGILHKTVAMWIRWWSCWTCRQSHRQSSVDCHAHQLSHSRLIVSHESEVSVSKELAESDQLSRHQVKLVLVLDWSTMDIPRLGTHHDQTHQGFHILRLFALRNALCIVEIEGNCRNSACMCAVISHMSICSSPESNARRAPRFIGNMREEMLILIFLRRKFG